ncbi:MAG: phosphoribosylformylglycinamidine synthase subunit PurQ [Fervidobacterium pennivorans]|jgi:phosphoribosylformylglycinamidine synthase|uniref:Phosphoribosylformylglycinamidine synthase subunit PurQ n=1 Tax=Fervidobacterium pennivorans TaxID=93466 RepID=A0A172T538_FERPE|nr:MULTISPECIES: phosphoribosylformylglycinamidine synthase subunit PurQ [Fervidobacterium]ANE42139.1 phosphoribosylformylglycinamidine synthase [Fervidobacterium pennivorans]MDM7320628.1 phosphoribosylformylglycinamidine synthase subunit PurQ [Fervidobacterium sp.]NPU88653.1 phosphoribosylformylglycinamidine synthase subunit PurQ [Fervidobacterium sp.]
MTLPKAQVVVYPGSNCDRDALWACKYVGFDAEFIDIYSDIDADLLVLPGGFSYGDYLRVGAVAAREPIAQKIKEFVSRGGLVIGICNGFQILVEMGLLDGALLQNSNGKFICKIVDLEIVDNSTPFTSYYLKGERIRLPIAHGFGRYVKTNDVNVALRYVEDVNGSDQLIAGITNTNKNVFGLMPHPERAMEKILGSDDGLRVFLSAFNYIKNNGGVRG